MYDSTGLKGTTAGKDNIIARSAVARGDLRFISNYVDALDGLGVIGFRAHSPDERVDLRSVAPATERAALLIYRLTR